MSAIVDAIKSVFDKRQRDEDLIREMAIPPQFRDKVDLSGIHDRGQWPAVKPANPVEGDTYHNEVTGEKGRFHKGQWYVMV